MKKFFCVLLTAVLLCTGSVVYVPQAEAAIVDSGTVYGTDITWTLDSNGTKTYTGTGALPDIIQWDGPPNFEYRTYSLIIGEGITGIGREFFSYSENLKTVSLPSTLTYIGDYAFSNCSMLQSINIPDSVQSIGRGAFAACKALQNINVPDGITAIEERTFNGCSALQVALPETVKSIGSYALCRVKKVSLGKNVKEIENGAFVCAETVEIAADNPYYTVVNGSVYNKDKSILLYYVTKASVTSATVEKTVRTVAPYAFSENDYLTTVTFAEGLVEISEYAFWYCRNLTKVILPDSLQKIGTCAFWGCEKLASINVPKSLQFVENASALSATAWYKNQADGMVYFGNVAISYKGKMPAYTDFTLKDGTVCLCESAFEDCANLNSVTIPASVLYLPESPFSYILSESGLSRIIVDPNNPVYCSENGVLYDKNKTVLIQYPAEKYGYTFSVPDTVKTIGTRAFNDVAYLCEVFIPDSVIEIRDDAFGYCSNLYSVTGMKNTEVIGEGAFSFCTSLSSFSVPEKVKAVKNSTFRGCRNLTRITLPVGLEEIGYWGFAECTFSVINIPETVKTIGGEAFVGNKNLQFITFPASVKKYGEMVLIACNNLKSVTMLSTDVEYFDNPFEGTFGPRDTVVVYGYANSTTEKIAKERYYNFIPLTCTHTGGAATCMKKAVCETCANEYGNLGDHDWGEWTIETAATLFETGLEKRVCKTNRNHVETRVLPMLTVLGTGVCGESLTWVLDSAGTLTVSGTGAMTDYASPADVPWDDYALRNAIRTLTVGDGVTAVGTFAFAYCTALADVQLADSVKAVGKDAFAATAWFNAQADGMVYAGNVAYKYKGTAVHGAALVLRDTVVSVSDSACAGVSGLTTVVLPASVAAVGKNAFDGCGDLQGITVLNAGCVLFDAAATLPQQTVICAAENSGAHAYAQKYERSFMTPVLPEEYSRLTDSGFCAVADETTVQELCGSHENIEVHNSEGALTDDDISLATGMKIVLKNEDTAVCVMEIVIPGDVDGNGDISASDARLALRNAVKLEELDGVYRQAALVSGSQKVTASEARLILRAAVQLENSSAWIEKY